MQLDVDTFLTTVYCVVDDFYQAEFATPRARRPGRRPTVSDSEVLTLAVLAQWQPRRSERAFVRYVHRHWPAYFPRRLSQSAFNRRVRDLGIALCYLGPHLAATLATHLGETATHEVADGVPVPLARRCRGRRQRLFADAAAVGRGGSDHDFYYGMKLWVVVNAQGVITGWILGPANTEERWLAEAVLRWRADPTAPAPTATEAPWLSRPHHGPPTRVGPTGPLGPRQAAGRATTQCYLSDLGLAGQEWQPHWVAAYGAHVLTKADYQPLPAADREAATRWLSGLRQAVETSFQALSDRWGLAFPRARTVWGVRTRLAAKVAAFNVAVLVNHQFGLPSLAFFDPLS
jgi:hypothetical protein